MFTVYPGCDEMKSQIYCTISVCCTTSFTPSARHCLSFHLHSTQENWERSTDTGSMNEFGETGRVLSTGRTSSNSWCRAECENVRTVLVLFCCL
jgi:hypothetical protein